MPQENRKHERVAVMLDVVWDKVSGNYCARTSDIGLGGCYIDTIGEAAVGERIYFKLHLPWGPWIDLQGVVVYRFPSAGFGVRFTDLPEETRLLLKQLLTYANQHRMVS